GRPAPPRPPRGPAPRRRTAGEVRPRGGGGEAGGHLLGRHEAPTRPGDGAHRRPPVVFLDEPTTGLDPRSRRTMWQIIRDLAAAGVTIFLTTQYLDEADELADQIAVLDKGKLVAEGTAEELKRLVPGGHINLQFADPAGLAAAADVLGDVSRDDDGLTLQIPSDGGVRSLRALLEKLDEASIEVKGVSIHTPDLDDVYFALT